MTTPRTIIEDALTFHLNRLSPGETLDADTLSVCLRALNGVLDEMSGARSLCFQEALITSATPISTANTTFSNAVWAGTAVGDVPLSFSHSLTAGGDQTMMAPLTVGQYQEITDKTLTGDPEFWVNDGINLYFYPVPTGHYLTVKVRLSLASVTIATLDSEYQMPAGYRAGLSALVAERLAPVMGGMNPAIAQVARGARLRLLAQSMRPAIVDTATPDQYDINRGF